MKTPTSPAQTVRIVTEIIIFSSTKTSWNHRKGYKCTRQGENRDQTPGVGVLLHHAPEKRIQKVLLKKKHDESIDIKLRKVILLNSQSTTDLLCNEEMVERIYKSNKKMRLRINGGKMVIDNKEVVAGYIKDVLFDKTAITNIFYLKNLIHQYRVTYVSLDQMFIVHVKENNKPNMNFIMHESDLHYYDPAEDSIFINMVIDNKKHYSKRNIKVEEREEELYGTVTYTSAADYIWDIQSNQIKD